MRITSALATYFLLTATASVSEAQLPEGASAVVVDDGRDQSGLDISVGLFVGSTIAAGLGTLSTLASSFVLIISGFGGGSTPPDLTGWNVALGVSFGLWIAGGVTLIIASILHSASRGRRAERVADSGPRLALDARGIGLAW